MTPEGRVKNMVRKALDTLGTDCYRFMPVQTGLGARTLDFLLSVRGRFVAIETKAPGKKLTPLQEGTKSAIEAAGGLVFVVWDETSLALAAKIIFALEFAPNGTTDRQRTAFAAIRQTVGRPELAWVAERTASPQAWPESEHEGAFEPAQAADEAAGGDHGAPAEPPKRAKPRPRRNDQRLTAAVSAFSEDPASPQGYSCDCGQHGKDFCKSIGCKGV